MHSLLRGYSCLSEFVRREGNDNDRDAGDFRDETETESETIPQRKHVF